MGGHKLTCKMTIRDGKAVYDPDGMILPEWMDAPDDYWVIHNPEPVGGAR